MFSTGVELRKAKKHDYSKLIDNDIFKMAYEDEDQDGESLKKKGKLNYVALMNNNKRSTVSNNII